MNLYHDGWVAWQTVVTGGNPSHFTLPLIEVKTKKIAGYVHATCLGTVDIRGCCFAKRLQVYYLHFIC